MAILSILFLSRKWYNNIREKAAAETPTRFSRKGFAMYIYAYLNEQDICVAVYELPAPVHDPQYIQMPSKDLSVVGQYFDRSLSEFKPVYYYAELNDKKIVTKTVFYLNPATTSELFRSITFEQYQTVTGLYWDGSEYITPPIHIQAVCSTDQVNYKSEDVWLTTVLEDMQRATAENTKAISDNDAKTQAVYDYANSRISTVDAAVNASVKALDERIADNTESILNLVTANAQNVIDIQNLEAVNTQQNAEISRIDHNVEAVIRSVKDHGSAINSLDEKLDSSINGVRADIADNLENIEALASSVSGVQTNVSTITSRVAKVENRATSLENRATALEKDVTTAKNNITSLTSRVKETEADISNIESEIGTLEGEVAGVITKANTNASNISALTSRVTAAESKLNTATTNITSLTTRTKAAENAIDAVEESVDSVKTDMKNYLPIAGGSVSGDLNVDGVLRVAGNQAMYYNADSKNLIIGTGNATTVTIAGANSGGTTLVNSAMFRPYSVIPRNSEALLGNTNFRWKGIYSQSAVNVSSDERLKESVEPLPVDKLAEFIKKLNVVSYKYIGTDEDRIGLIAQDVIKADSKLADYFVSKDHAGYYGLKPADLVFPLIAAVQKLQDEVEQLKK